VPAASAFGDQPAGNGRNGDRKRGKRVAGGTNILRGATSVDIGRCRARIRLLVRLQVADRMDDRRRLPEQQEQNQQGRQPALRHGMQWNERATDAPWRMQLRCKSAISE